MCLRDNASRPLRECLKAAITAKRQYTQQPIKTKSAVITTPNPGEDFSSKITLEYFLL
jgi:hypothetical protein